MKKKSSLKKDNGNDKMMILMIICVLLSLTTLAIVAYDKFIKQDNKQQICSTCWNRD